MCGRYSRWARSVRGIRYWQSPPWHAMVGSAAGNVRQRTLCGRSLIVDTLERAGSGEPPSDGHACRDCLKLARAAGPAPGNSPESG